MPTRWIDAGTTQVHAVTWQPANTPGHGPVLLVHGLGGSTVEWSSAAPLLAQGTDREVVAIDLPGFGRTRLGRASAGLDAQRDVVATVLEELGPATVVGGSMGGLLALGLAARRPEMVRGLVLVAPALPDGAVGIGDLPAAARFALAALPVAGPRLLDARRRRLGPERTTAERLRALLAHPEHLDPEVRLRMVELADERLGYGEVGRAYSEALRTLIARRSSVWDDVPRVTAPTLVVHGERDALIPVSVAERLRDRRPDWSVERFEECGHLPHLEQPERFADALARWMRFPATTA